MRGNKLLLLAALVCVAGCETQVQQAVNACNGRNRGETVAQIEESCSAAMAVSNGLDGPNTAGALVNRGAAYLASDDLDSAILDFSAAIQINPYLAPAYSNRATAYMEKGNFTAAEADMDRSIQLRPNDFRSYNLRCRIHGVENTQLDDALADCNKALKIAPGNPNVLNSLGVVEMRRGQFVEALDSFNQALNKGPVLNAGTLYMRGVCKRNLGDTAGGDADIATAKAERPDIEAHLATLRLIH